MDGRGSMTERPQIKRTRSKSLPMIEDSELTKNPIFQRSVDSNRHLLSQSTRDRSDPSVSIKIGVAMEEHPASVKTERRSRAQTSRGTPPQKPKTSKGGSFLVSHSSSKRSKTPRGRKLFGKTFDFSDLDEETIKNFEEGKDKDKSFARTSGGFFETFSGSKKKGEKKKVQNLFDPVETDVIKLHYSIKNLHPIFVKSGHFEDEVMTEFEANLVSDSTIESLNSQILQKFFPSSVISSISPIFNSCQVSFLSPESEEIEIKLSDGESLFDFAKSKNISSDYTISLNWDPIQMQSVGKRQHIVQEMLLTERSFLGTLLEMTHHSTAFSQFVDKDAVSQVFGNLTAVVGISVHLHNEIEKRIENWDDEKSLLGDVFIKFVPFLNFFTEWGLKHDTSIKCLKKLKQNEKVRTYLDKKVKSGLTLEALLIQPVQRLPRLILLCKDLCKATPDDHPDKNNLTQCVPKLQAAADSMNQHLRQQETVELLRESYGAAFQMLAQPNRTVVWKDKLKADFSPLGKCNLVSPGTTRETFMFYLFNDTLAFCPIKDATEPETQPTIVPLSLVWLMPSSSKSSKWAHVLIPHLHLRLKFSDLKERHNWENDLKKNLIPLGENKSNKSFFLKDIHSMELCHRGNEKYDYKEEDLDFDFTDQHRAMEDTIENFFGGKEEEEEEEELGPEGMIVKWGSFLFSNGTSYIGFWEGGTMSGWGMFHSTESTFIGMWKNGLRDGKGEIKLKNGSSIKGLWKKGKLNGPCVYVRYDGMKYQGCMIGLKRHDVKGRLEYPNGDLYEGSFVNDQISGKGKMSTVSGWSFEGDWEKGQMHGNGKYVSKDYTYSGSWDHGLKHGHGEYISNGVEYNGSWEKNSFHGQGYLKNANGIFQGDFEHGVKEGKCIAHYSSGAEYVGEFKSDRRNCYEGGKFKFPSGATYEGGWLDDHLHGKGFLKVREFTFEGTWKEGCRDGQFSLTIEKQKSLKVDSSSVISRIGTSVLDKTKKSRSSKSSLDIVRVSLHYRDGEVISPLEWGWLNDLPVPEIDELFALLAPTH